MKAYSLLRCIGDLDSATISSTLTELGAADVGMQFIRLNEGLASYLKLKNNSNSNDKPC